MARLSGVEGAAELQAAIRAPVLLLDSLEAEPRVPSNAVPEAIAERYPVRITGGNLLPVLRNGAQDLVTLSNASFDHSGRGCDSL